MKDQIYIFLCNADISIRTSVYADLALRIRVGTSIQEQLNHLQMIPTEIMKRE